MAGLTLPYSADSVEGHIILPSSSRGKAMNEQEWLIYPGDCLQPGQLVGLDIESMSEVKVN